MTSRSALQWLPLIIRNAHAPWRRPGTRPSLSFCAAALAAACACTTALPAAAQANASPPAAAAADDRSVLAQALAALRKTAMNRDQVDWPAASAEAERRLAGGAPLLDVLQWLVVQLKDGHSRVMSPAEAQAMANAPSGAAAAPAGRAAMPAPIDPAGRLVAAASGLQLGYLRVPYLISTDPKTMADFGGKLAALQKSLAAQGARGWIVDLRGNVGGNQWPMLAGLSGLLGDGAHGSVVTPDGQRMTWGTSAGSAWMNSPDQVAISDDTFKAADTSAWPLAVLTNQRTASSGESLAISLRGRAGTRSFGDATRGRSSANSLVPLGNGALLAITTSVLFDRQGKSYGGPIEPDERFGLPAPGRDDPHPGEGGLPDPVLARAVQWLDTVVPPKR
jgi:hypothetical protein